VNFLHYISLPWEYLLKLPTIVRYYQDNVPIILTIKFLLQEKKMKTMSTLLEPRQLLILVLGMPL
jgi:hypothetical protein